MELFLGFARLSLLSIGGNVSAMLYTDFVSRRGWVEEKAFIEGLALSQTLPGVNIVNLSIWIGYLLHRTSGAVTAFLGMVLPAGVLIIGIGATLKLVENYTLTKHILGGVAAAALGLSLNLAARTARHALTSHASTVIFAAALVASLMQVPIWLIVSALCPVSIGLAYRRMRNGEE